LEERKPVWTTSSFLLYAGGFTVLASALAALGYLSSRYGSGAYAAWSLLLLAALYAIARGFGARGRSTAAGVFAFASLIAWVAFLAALWAWFGWLHVRAGTSVTIGLNGKAAQSGGTSPFAGFSVARLSLYLLVLAAARHDRHRFGFPLLRLVSAVAGWLFVTDLVSGGGTWSAVVTLLVGLAYLAIGSGSDEPSAFWLHLVGGLLIGGSLLRWWHQGDWRWALLCVASLVYVAIARRTGRSSWAVLGAIGLLAASTHFASEWTGSGFSLVGEGASASGNLWVPSCVFAFTGFLLVALGLRARTVSDG
jgi:hypothetical protein